MSKREDVLFSGKIKASVSGESASDVNFDFKERWPQSAFMQYNVTGDTTFGIDFGTITTGKILVVQSEHPVVVNLNGNNAFRPATCRSFYALQCDSTTGTIKNKSTQTANTVKVFVAGV